MGLPAWASHWIQKQENQSRITPVGVTFSVKCLYKLCNIFWTINVSANVTLGNIYQKYCQCMYPHVAPHLSPPTAQHWVSMCIRPIYVYIDHLKVFSRDRNGIVNVPEGFLCNFNEGLEEQLYSLEQYIGCIWRLAFIHYCGLHQVWLEAEKLSACIEFGSLRSVKVLKPMLKEA